MDTDKLNSWLALAANLGVLVGIVFVVIEVRQNSEITRAQMTQSRADTAILLASEWGNSDYMPAIAEKIHLGDDLTYQEMLRYRTWVRAFLRNHQNNYLQYKNGYLRNYIPDSTAAAVRSIISNQYSRDYWNESRINYSDEFVEFVDQAVADTAKSKQLETEN